MDRKNLRILLTALILILAVFLGMELADARHPKETQAAAITEETAGSTLPPNMLPIG